MSSFHNIPSPQIHRERENSPSIRRLLPESNQSLPRPVDVETPHQEVRQEIQQEIQRQEQNQKLEEEVRTKFFADTYYQALVSQFVASICISASSLTLSFYEFTPKTVSYFIIFTLLILKLDIFYDVVYLRYPSPYQNIQKYTSIVLGLLFTFLYCIYLNILNIWEHRPLFSLGVYVMLIVFHTPILVIKQGVVQFYKPAYLVSTIFIFYSFTNFQNLSYFHPLFVIQAAWILVFFEPTTPQNYFFQLMPTMVGIGCIMLVWQMLLLMMVLEMMSKLASDGEVGEQGEEGEWLTSYSDIFGVLILAVLNLCFLGVLICAILGIYYSFKFIKNQNVDQNGKICLGIFLVSFLCSILQFLLLITLKSLIKKAIANTMVVKKISTTQSNNSNSSSYSDRRNNSDSSDEERSNNNNNMTNKKRNKKTKKQKGPTGKLMAMLSTTYFSSKNEDIKKRRKTNTIKAQFVKDMSQQNGSPITLDRVESMQELQFHNR